MSCRGLVRVSAGIATTVTLGSAHAAYGCAVCFGGEGDPVATGLPIGVAVLLLPLALVQAVLIRFFVRLIRARTPPRAPARARTS